jgi:hypothetical protein
MLVHTSLVTATSENSAVSGEAVPQFSNPFVQDEVRPLPYSPPKPNFVFNRFDIPEVPNRFESEFIWNKKERGRYVYTFIVAWVSTFCVHACVCMCACVCVCVCVCMCACCPFLFAFFFIVLSTQHTCVQYIYIRGTQC